MKTENPVACCVELVRSIAPDLPRADLQEVVSGALLRISQGTEHYISAVRWSLGEWLRQAVDVPTEDKALAESIYLDTGKRQGRHAQNLARTIRQTRTQIDGANGWKALFSRCSETDQRVAAGLAAGWAHRDIAAETRLPLGTVESSIRRIRRKMSDYALWHPILDALFSLPDSKQGRAAYVTDLAEYRTKRVPSAVRRPPSAKTVVRFRRCWNDSVLLEPKREHEQRTPRSAPWYPGMPYLPNYIQSIWFPGMPTRGAQWERVRRTTYNHVPARWAPGMPIRHAWNWEQRKPETERTETDNTGWLWAGLTEQSEMETETGIGVNAKELRDMQSETRFAFWFRRVKTTGRIEKTVFWRRRIRIAETETGWMISSVPLFPINETARRRSLEQTHFKAIAEGRFRVSFSD